MVYSAIPYGYYLLRSAGAAKVSHLEKYDHNGRLQRRKELGINDPPSRR
jgi:hypothetical protein